MHIKCGIVTVCCLAAMVLCGLASQVGTQTKDQLYVQIVPEVKADGSWTDQVYSLNQILGSAFDRMDDEPSFHMSFGNPALYDLLRRTAPGVFGEIRSKVESGALEPLGGMWTDLDPWTIDEESLARSVLYGKSAM